MATTRNHATPDRFKSRHTTNAWTATTTRKPGIPVTSGFPGSKATKSKSASSNPEARIRSRAGESVIATEILARSTLNFERRPKRDDGASRTRTGDLLGAIQALSQLSYSPAV